MATKPRFQSTIPYPVVNEIPAFPFEQGTFDERSLRLAMLDAFLNCPTDRLEILRSLHARLLARDPLFYGHLASWYSQKGEARAHKEIFLAHLLTGTTAGHREAAFMLLQGFAPHEVSKMMDYCKRVLGKFPRSAKTAMTRYLRAREANPRWFDAEVLRGKKFLKHIYASLRISPSARARNILFMKEPPPGSPPWHLRKLRHERDPAEQARIILENHIPCLAAISSLEDISPELITSLAQAMPIQELKSCLKALRNRGALKDPGVKEIIEGRLITDATSPPDTFSPRSALFWRRMEILEKIMADIEPLINECLEKNMKIRKPTAICIDRSGSMEIVSLVGLALATLCSALKVDAFYMYLFNNMATPVDAGASLLSRWEDSLKVIVTEGSTSLGAPLEMMLERNERAEQMILVTDGNENSSPFFTDMYATYSETMMTSPHIILVKVGHFNEKFARVLSTRKISHSLYDFTSSPLAELAAALCQPSYSEILEEIMSTELPRRHYRQVLRRDKQEEFKKYSDDP